MYLHETLFQPCIDYCIGVWGYAADKYLNKVQRIMNRASRIITEKNRVRYTWGRVVRTA